MQMQLGCQPRLGSFSLCGNYRVQSKQRMVQSSLTGIWLDSSAYGCLDAEAVTRFARAHPACLDPEAVTTLTPALVTTRTGAFASNEDALYYGDHFEVTEGADILGTDILDVPKLQNLWRERRIVLEQLVQPDLHTTRLLESEITPIAIDEYMCHEGGHLLGMSVHQKQRHGYFRLGGKFRWPLVYLEEFRADINAWDLALTHLDSARAREVICYTLLHRLGLAARNLWRGLPGAGFVPFLDFSVARRAGLIQVEPHASLPIRFFTGGDAIRLLHREVVAVAERLTLPDRHQPELWDVAQRSMSWLDDSLRDEEAVSAFRTALSPTEGVARGRAVPESRSLLQ